MECLNIEIVQGERMQYIQGLLYRVEYRRGCIYASLNIRGVDIEIVQGGCNETRSAYVWV